MVYNKTTVSRQPKRKDAQKTLVYFMFRRPAILVSRYLNYELDNYRDVEIYARRYKSYNITVKKAGLFNESTQYTRIYESRTNLNSSYAKYYFSIHQAGALFTFLRPLPLFNIGLKSSYK
mgnify:CR=1 FL=1